MAEEQFLRTQSVVEEFGKEEGEGLGESKLCVCVCVCLLATDYSTELDKRLRQLDLENKHTSYISGAHPLFLNHMPSPSLLTVPPPDPPSPGSWYHMYLASRNPLVLNYSPFMASKEDPPTSDHVPTPCPPTHPLSP